MRRLAASMPSALSTKMARSVVPPTPIAVSPKVSEAAFAAVGLPHAIATRASVRQLFATPVWPRSDPATPLYMRETGLWEPDQQRSCPQYLHGSSLHFSS